MADQEGGVPAPNPPPAQQQQQLQPDHADSSLPWTCVDSTSLWCFPFQIV